MMSWAVVPLRILTTPVKTRGLSKHASSVAIAITCARGATHAHTMRRHDAPCEGVVRAGEGEGVSWEQAVRWERARLRDG